MKILPTPIPGLLVLEPVVFRDERGFFMESFNALRFAEAAGVAATFVQDNHSGSRKGALRGLHYQVEQPQGKLIRVVRGRIFDVAVDIRPGSASYGRWAGMELSAENARQVWIPPGFAHGYLALSDEVEFVYKVTDYYAPAHERSLAWDDPDLAISWPLAELGISSPVLSAKDRAGARFSSMAPQA